MPTVGDMLGEPVKLRIDESRLWWVRVKFEYNQELVAWVRSIPGTEKSFDKKTKTWRLPIEVLSLFFKEAKKYGCECDVSLPGCRSAEGATGTGTAAHFEL